MTSSFADLTNQLGRGLVSGVSQQISQDISGTTTKKHNQRFGGYSVSTTTSQSAAKISVYTTGTPGTVTTYGTPCQPPRTFCSVSTNARPSNFFKFKSHKKAREMQNAAMHSTSSRPSPATHSASTRPSPATHSASTRPSPATHSASTRQGPATRSTSTRPSPATYSIPTKSHLTNEQAGAYTISPLQDRTVTKHGGHQRFTPAPPFCRSAISHNREYSAPAWFCNELANDATCRNILTGKSKHLAKHATHETDTHEVDIGEDTLRLAADVAAHGPLLLIRRKSSSSW